MTSLGIFNSFAFVKFYCIHRGTCLQFFSDECTWLSEHFYLDFIDTTPDMGNPSSRAASYFLCHKLIWTEKAYKKQLAVKIQLVPDQRWFLRWPCCRGPFWKPWLLPGIWGFSRPWPCEDRSTRMRRIGPRWHCLREHSPKIGENKVYTK